MVHIFLYFSLFFPLSDSDLTSWFESNFFGKICQNHHCCSPPIYPTSCYQFNLSCSDFACVKTEAPPTIETIIYFASKQRREKSSENLIYLFYRERYLLGFWTSHEILQRTHGKFRFLFLCIFFLLTWNSCLNLLKFLSLGLDFGQIGQHDCNVYTLYHRGFSLTGSCLISWHLRCRSFKGEWVGWFSGVRISWFDIAERWAHHMQLDIDQNSKI